MNHSQGSFRVLVAAAVLAIVAPLAFGSEVSAVWERIYRQAVTDDQRYAIMLKITELKDKDFAPLIAESLQNLYTAKIESGDASEKNIKLSLAKLLVRELGNLRSLDNAQLVFDVYRNSKDALLRGEAALSLGKMRAVEFVEFLANDLRDINLQPILENSRSQEINAYGLVQGLELMHSPLGFEPVFFASIGWYSGASQIKETAKAALKTMVDDASPLLKAILIKEVKFDRKLKALEAVDDTKSTDASKIDLARVGLEQGLIPYDKDQQNKRILYAMRIQSIKILINAKDTGEATVPLYQQAIANPLNNDELLACYSALGHNASPAAVNLLIKKMSEYNERQKTGLQVATDRPVISQIVASLIMTKNPAVKPILIEAQYSGHDAQVVRDVKKGLDQIP